MTIHVDQSVWCRTAHHVVMRDTPLSDLNARLLATYTGTLRRLPDTTSKVIAVPPLRWQVSRGGMPA